jgi:hypothetical protein
MVITPGAFDFFVEPVFEVLVVVKPGHAVQDSHFKEFGVFNGDGRHFRKLENIGQFLIGKGGAVQFGAQKEEAVEGVFTQQGGYYFRTEIFEVLKLIRIGNFIFYVFKGKNLPVKFNAAIRVIADDFLK